MRLTWRALSQRAGDGPGALLTLDGLSDAGIVAGFSTRLGGRSRPPLHELNVSAKAGDDPESVASNRERIFEALGLTGSPWVQGEQVHGAGVAEVSEPGDGVIGGVDALVTGVAGHALAVVVADCVPILIADPSRRRVGVVHAGWRGLVAGVVDAAVASLAPGRDAVAVIGPSIGPCCFEVGPEVAEAAVQALGPSVRIDTAASPHVDLWGGTAVALRRSGITRIAAAALCTRCEPHRFFSHRAGSAGRQAVVAAVTAG